MNSSVQVITAGGAAANKKKKRRRNRKRATPAPEQETPSASVVAAVNVVEKSRENSPAPGNAALPSELELETSQSQLHEETPVLVDLGDNEAMDENADNQSDYESSDQKAQLVPPTVVQVPNNGASQSHSKSQDLFWLFFCFLGIMASFVCYGLLLEYTTSGGRELHELSFLFVTSLLYTATAAFGRYVRAETPTTIPPARFAVLGLTSMGSTFCSVRSLRYVIYPIQVLAKSCKPVPVMIFGALMGKTYPLRKYINVLMIVLGVALFMGGGDSKKGNQDSDKDSASQIVGLVLLFVSLCFDGGTGAYEDKLMSVHSVGPFDLMYNIQLGKTILAGISLLVLNQLHIFLQMCQEMGFLLVALGLSGAMGQVFIFVTISKFGALTCSIIGLARKVTTLVASIYFYGHHLNGVQFAGLVISVGSMVMNFMGKKKGGDVEHGHGGPKNSDKAPMEPLDEEMQKFLDNPEGQWQHEQGDGDVELTAHSKSIN